MAITSCQSTVEAIIQHTHDVREIALRLKEPRELPFIAGQYINFMVPAPNKPKPVSRLYSIGSAPSERGIIRVVYNFVGGPGTTFLQGLTGGMPVTFKGPFGHFVLKTDSARDVLFVATGTGIVPFYSMLQEYFGHADGGPLQHRRVTLLWSVRRQEDLYYQDALRALEKKFANFRFLMTLTRPDDGWQGLRGRVTALFADQVKGVDNIEIYCCGSDAMITDITALAKARGACPVYREKYF
ncbi:MAG: FAD-dependent oxidoreductase [Deltaproteobacteria bacterium]|nr:FAD-dependent oxidoreductase [Deltaproteobacteria bacterium]